MGPCLFRFTGPEFEYLLEVLGCSQEWFFTDAEDYPWERDLSETGESQLSIQSWNPIAYREPQVFPRGVPVEVSTWLNIRAI